MFHLLLHAGREAWQDSQQQNTDKNRCGIIIGNIALPTEYSSKYTSQVLGPLFSDSQNLENVYPADEIDGLNRYVAGLPAGVLAQALGLHGATYTMDAACASSLYALKYASDELLSGRADCMLAGGLSRPDSLYTQMGFSQLHALSASGNCSPFSDQGDGLVVGEGAGIFVLKRLSDALEHGDHIYARIAGIGLSNDIEGNLFLPASEGQGRAMADAYAQAGWAPSSIDHIECHGTGTPKGDAVEFQSLKNLWADEANETKESKCIIGSVKSNVGHLLTGAGAAGLMKTLLALKHKTLPPTAHFKNANPALKLDESSFDVLQQSESWPEPQEHARRAAISAFGFGGINAHVLIEEYREDAVYTRNTGNTKSTNSTPSHNDEDIAIVGLAAHFGKWDSLEAVRNRMFDIHENSKAHKPDNWYASSEAKNFSVFNIDAVDVPIGRFRIPPKELEDLLPQQLLMLLMAADAVDDVSGKQQLDGNRELALRSGVYIGIGLDPQTCNFHLRWELEEKLRAAWGNNIPDEQQEEYLAKLRDVCNTPLTANRTMGALGGIVASRIARALQCGGPSFTVSNEECSGMQALETAVRSLRNNDIDQAIIGAVDFASDIRSVFSHHQNRSDENNIFADGACAFVAKRLTDAERDGDRIYACVRGISKSNYADIQSARPLQDAYDEVLHQAYTELELPLPQLIISHGSAENSEVVIEQQAINAFVDKQETAPVSAIAVSSAIADIGHSGAASGLASVLKACLSLHHRSIPLDRSQHTYHSADIYKPQHARYWLHNDLDGPRIAAATSMSCDGNVMHTVLSEAPQRSENILPSISQYPQAMFYFSAENTEQLVEELNNCRQFLKSHKDSTIHKIAATWSMNKSQHSHTRCSCVVDSPAQLNSCLEQLHTAIVNGEDLQLPHVFYTTAPLHQGDDIAFVFPGSGNHFIDMGSSISSYWPQVLDEQSIGSDYYKAQFADGKFWSEDSCDDFDHRDVIFGQVWYGAMLSDVMSSFGLKPNAVIGYSLGETAGFFATRTWTDRDGMLERIQNTSLFTTDLAGICQSVRDTWKCTDDEVVDWSIALVDKSVEEVKEIIDAYARVYVLIINTPNECVIGGDAQQVSALVKELNASAHAIDGVTTVHCEVAEPVAKAYRDLHLFNVTPPKDVRFYSGIRAASYDVTTDSAADSIIGQALEPFNYAKNIQQAYDDGIRIFIEMGPRGTCTRMIDVTLKDQPHCALSASIPGQDGSVSCMRSCAQLFAQGVDLNAGAFYEQDETAESKWKNFISVANGKSEFDLVSKPQPAPINPGQHIKLQATDTATEKAPDAAPSFTPAA
ncbi:MAG: acyltransferase domain-containing protein, partial [Planctomycetes bacterium]|nr:acyltransferase domain-containing protein [Planctomycetota bacterium]